MRKIFSRKMGIIGLVIAALAYGITAYSYNCQYNLVLISLNATRADHLKTYGYKRNTAPNIDKLAGEALLFEQAIAQSHWTLSSQASILTSKYVRSLGIYDRTEKLSEKQLTLPEILKMYNYRTAAFVGGLDMAAVYGFNQGFDYFFDDTKDKPVGYFKDIIPRAIKWLRENKNKKFFLFIQGYDVHSPYNPPELYVDMYDPAYKGIIDDLTLDYALLKNIRDDTLLLNGKPIHLAENDIDHIVARYDACISYADKFIGELLKEIEALNLAGKTIIIILSEHGEELLDHGSFDRFGQKNLYEEVIHVPLIIKHPDIKGRRIANQVQCIDILPTILDLLGIPINKEAQGLSLVPLIKGKRVKKEFNFYVFSEAAADKWTIRTSDWKLIYDRGNYELYNLKEDGTEKNNLARQKPDLVYTLVQKASAWQRNTKTDRSPDDTRVELTEEMKKKLRRAGYW